MKKKLLFVYPDLMVGGSTTSLMSLLNNIDYSKYEVDLLLYSKSNTFYGLPAEVNVLDEAAKYPAYMKGSKFKRICLFLFTGIFLKALYVEVFYKKKIGFNNQVMSIFYKNLSKKLDAQYDVAIGYLELWADYYVVEKVNAHKKVIWIHIDYLNAGFIPSLDAQMFRKADKIICVSENCKRNFTKIFPQLCTKTEVIENILSAKYIIQKAQERDGIEDVVIEYDGLKLITVCRLSILVKGIDRAIQATIRLKAEGYQFKWFIVGDGEDYHIIKKMVDMHDLEEYFILLGEKENPYPYIHLCDVYVMASRREGKPVAVTEAQILGKPIIVTNYSSATEQVNNMEDGIIVDNVDDGIYKGIKEVLANPALISKFKNNLFKRNLSNENSIENFYKVIK